MASGLLAFKTALSRRLAFPRLRDREALGMAPPGPAAVEGTRT